MRVACGASPRSRSGRRGQTVTLRRGGVYTLTTVLFGPAAGIYRIRVDFFDAPAGVVRFSDYSGQFEIR